jgi:hypothetical protein
MGRFPAHREIIFIMRLRFLRAACAALSLAVLLTGCQSKPATPNSRKGLAEIKVQRIALMPFIKGLYDTSPGAPISRLLYCTIADLCANTTEVTGNADKQMTVLLQEALRARYNTALIPLETVWAVYAGLPKKPSADTPQSLSLALGSELKADHVMVGIVWRYKERVGTAQASASPASVAFSLYLINVNEAIPVWMATFDKTQEALTDNVLDVKEFFSMGARWLTPEELARYGINKVLQEPGGIL